MKLIPILFFFLIVGCNTIPLNNTIDASDYGLAEGIDNTPALIKAMEACKDQKATRLLIPYGRYDIYPQKALEGYRNVPNNDDGKKRIVFMLDGFKNFEIDGQGTEFICHDHMLPFDLNESQNITIKNLSIDWDMPFFFQAQVVAVHPDLNAFDLKVMDGCKYEIQGDQLIFSNKKTEKTKGWYSMAPPAQKDVIWEQNINWNIWFDPITKAPAFNVEGLGRLSAWNFKLNLPATAKELSPNLVRLTNAANQFPKIGWVLIIKGKLTKNRLSPAINIANCKNINLENINVHHSAGIALIATRTENISLDRYNVILPPNSERMVTSTADATHFVNCKGLIKFDNCIMENMLDDATNVHGVYCNVESLVDDYTLGLVRGHSQQQGYVFAQKGDKIQLVDRRNLKPYADLTVASVKNINEYYFEVAFDQKVNEILHEESTADNISWQPDVEMRNCIIRQNRSRGILISTAGNVLIESNKFIRSSYAGVMGAGDASYWYESGPVKNLVIRNNLFEDLGVGPGSAPILTVCPEIDITKDSTWYYHKNIVFEGNTIITFSKILVQAKSIENFLFKNNTIQRSTDYPVIEDKNAPAFVFEGCKGVVIEDNDYNWGGMASIKVDGMTKDLISNNNRNIESVKF